MNIANLKREAGFETNKEKLFKATLVKPTEHVLLGFYLRVHGNKKILRFAMYNGNLHYPMLDPNP